MTESTACTPDEMMTVAAARLLWDGCVCFVGIGLPSAAANLARHTHAPDIVLIYESGTVGTRPDVLPLSIGDGELADTATAVVPLPEIFAYWLQGGRIDVGLPRRGADRPVRQPQQHGHRRLRAAEDAPARRRRRARDRDPRQADVRRAEAVRRGRSCRSSTSAAAPGFLDGPGARARSGAPGAGPQVVITDLGVLKPEPGTDELQLVARYEGITWSRPSRRTGWPLNVADRVDVVAPPTDDELRILRDLHERTRRGAQPTPVRSAGSEGRP